MPKLRRVLLTVFLAFCLPFASGALAAAPSFQPQVPGYYRIHLGSFEVTALFDGTLELDKALLHGAGPQQLDGLLKKNFVGNPKMQTALNAYLINTGEQLILVDTGAGQLFGPGLGEIVANMKAAGYAPEKVDSVLLTHMHGDHVGGLLDADQKALFPKATIYVNRQESAFWLSQKNAEAAPEAMKSFFAMARNAAAPYLATGRWQTFDADSSPIPGITALAAYGHTPGHTAFLVSSEEQTLLIWGDLVHAHAVQFAHPEVSIEFDVDQKAAVATRQTMMAQAATKGTLIAGMHLPFPGLGHLRTEGKGYAWVPIEFSPLPDDQE